MGSVVTEPGAGPGIVAGGSVGAHAGAMSMPSNMVRRIIVTDPPELLVTM
jgi:hypothetical protein